MRLGSVLPSGHEYNSITFLNVWHSFFNPVTFKWDLRNEPPEAEILSESGDVRDPADDLRASVLNRPRGSKSGTTIEGIKRSYWCL